MQDELFLNSIKLTVELNSSIAVFMLCIYHICHNHVWSSNRPLFNQSMLSAFLLLYADVSPEILCKSIFPKDDVANFVLRSSSKLNFHSRRSSN